VLWLPPGHTSESSHYFNVRIARAPCASTGPLPPALIRQIFPTTASLTNYFAYICALELLGHLSSTFPHFTRRRRFVSSFGAPYFIAEAASLASRFFS